MFTDRKEAAIRCELIYRLEVILHLITEELREFDCAVALLGFWRSDHLLAVYDLIRFVDTESSLLEIKIRSCKSEQFTFTDTCPEQDLEAVIRHRLVLHDIRKLKVFILRPEEHFLRFRFAQFLKCVTRILREIVILNRVIEYRGQLIVDRSKIRIGISLTIGITFLEKLVLPLKDMC